MKHIITVTYILLFSTTLFSSEFPDPGCYTNNLFYLDGWKIHSPEDFDEILNIQLTKLEQDLDNDKTALDYPGDIRNEFSYEFYELLYVEPYLSKPVDYTLRKSDYVVTSVAVSLGYDGEYNDPGEYTEIRWFDGKYKHIVYNKNVVKCIPTKPPLAFNSLY